jgi:hypothetical protein
MNIIKEEWKKIPINNEKHLDDKYEVSNLGNLRNTQTNMNLKPHITNGYYTINLPDLITKKTISLSVNRIVLIAFKGIDKENNKCNHIDGNKLNNTLSDLEWTTQKNNIKHAYDNNLVKINKKIILKYDLDDNLINEYESIMKACEDLTVSRHAIVKVLSGKNQTAGGFIWKYKDITNEKIDVPKNMITIANYPKYMVSKKGEIYSLTTKRYLKPIKNASGYHYVTVSDGVKKKNLYIHTIVANAFIEKIDGKDFVNHIDGNKINNTLQNLEWVSHPENVIHAHKLKKLKN